jgi:tetratricopeptide (TPR) repeat protein
MKTATPPKGVRVERALRVFPAVDVLAPLRALVIARSRASGFNAPHLTVGKRSIDLSDMHALIPEAVLRFSAHLTAVYSLVATALDAQARDDIGAAVAALLKASKLEVAQGREAAAREWVQHALTLAELAIDRRPEIDAILALAELDLARGALERAARRAQRALAMAEVARAKDAIAAACLVLGKVAATQNSTAGAIAWFTRGMDVGLDDKLLKARFELYLGEVLSRRGSIEESEARLHSAERVFREATDTAGIALALKARARVAASDGRTDEALLIYREALAVTRGAVGALIDTHGELLVRLRLCQLFLSKGRLLEAEDEARRAEEVAIEHNHTRELVRVYLVFGGIRAAQRDESGMVFFEKAIELCRGAAPSLHLEADAYHGYAEFFKALGRTEESDAYFERERELRDLMVAPTAP